MMLAIQLTDDNLTIFATRIKPGEIIMMAILDEKFQKLGSTS